MAEQAVSPDPDKDARAGSQAPRPPWYADPQIRSYITQAIVFALVILFIYYIVQNTRYNLEKAGIAGGFAFWGETAGFDIGFGLIPHTATSTYGNAVWLGFYNTLLVSAIGIVLATFIGLVVGVARLSNNWLIARLATVYVEVLRNVPLLLQLFFWYFAVLGALPAAKDSLTIADTIFLNNGGLIGPKPIFEDGFNLVWAALIGALILSIIIAKLASMLRERTGRILPTIWICLILIIAAPIAAYFYMGEPLSFEHPVAGRFRLQGGITVVPEFMALLLGLSLYTGAFIAENVRAGIISVSKGQWEAAGALGIKPSFTMRLVVLPQALRVIIPPQTSQYLNLTKNSSLGVAIGYPDLVGIGGTVLNQTGQAVEMVAIWMLVYVSLSLLTSVFMNWYNARIALVER